MYGSSPFRSTLNTCYITTLDMCEVCTEAVQSVALWNTSCITTLDMCEACKSSVISCRVWHTIWSRLVSVLAVLTNPGCGMVRNSPTLGNHSLNSVCTDTHSVHACFTMQYKLILHLRLDMAQELAKRRVAFLLVISLLEGLWLWILK